MHHQITATFYDIVDRRLKKIEFFLGIWMLRFIGIIDDERNHFWAEFK
jgi:hypothetical protein